jgi:ribosomal-protein-alanine N-acetyltransferase
MELVHPERVIEAGEVRLEPILPAHAAALFRDLQAPELYTFIPHDPPQSVEELERRYTRWAQRRSADGNELWLNYAVYRPSDAVYVGTVQATLESSGKTLIAYEVFPRFWRRHLGSQACTALVDRLFDDYDVPAVSALTDTRNVASRKLLESLGFRRTGTIENADEFKGSVSDEYAYEIGRAEWAQRRVR